MIHAQVFGLLRGEPTFRDSDDDRDAMLAFTVVAKPDPYRDTRPSVIHCKVYGSRARRWRDRFADGRRCVLAGTLSLRRDDGDTFLAIRVDTLEFINPAGRHAFEGHDDAV
jgi:hypothetical protein